MRERIHEKPGAQDLTDQEAKTVVDYLAKNFSDTTPKADPNGRLSRTLLQGDAAKYIAVDYAVREFRTRHFTTSRWIRGESPG